MCTAVQENYISAVTQGFLNASPNPESIPLRTQVVGWLSNGILKGELEQQEADEIAKEYLTKLIGTVPVTNQTRYKFAQLTATDQLIKIIFDESFKKAPEDIIVYAERASPNNRSFYPLWRRVCWLKAPKLAAATCQNFWVKVAVSLAAIYVSYIVLNKCYLATANFIAGRAIPFIINNASLHVIHAFNRVMAAKDWIFLYKWKILTYSFIAQAVMNRANIPYLTPFVNAFTPWNIYRVCFIGPQSTVSYLTYLSIDTASSFWKSCNSTGIFFREIALRTEKEYMLIGSRKAYEVWITTIAESRLSPTAPG